MGILIHPLFLCFFLNILIFFYKRNLHNFIAKNYEDVKICIVRYVDEEVVLSVLKSVIERETEWKKKLKN